MAKGRTRIELCGRLLVELRGRRVERELAGRQGRLLFAYLVFNRDRTTSRDELMDLLWPTDPPADPDAVLTAALSKLRRVLGKEVLQGKRELQTELPPGAWIDVEAARDALDRAERALARSDWTAAASDGRSATEVAGRTFLSGQQGPWVEEVRRELEELRVRALECVAAADLELGSYGPAERAARAAIAMAPFRESGHLLLMRTLAAAGNRAAALQAYEELRVRLRDELGAAPGAALIELHESLLDDRAAAPARATEPAPVLDARTEERKLVTVVAVRVADHEDPRAADPERLHRVVADAREAVSGEVGEAGGRLEAGLGEELLAVFGAPVAQQDHVERALHCALALRRRASERVDEAAPLRIGVDTGEVLVTRGSPIAGGAVATARRLADAARAGEIMVSERTAAAGRRAFELGASAGPRAGAGAKPLLRALSVARSAPGGPRPFVGRDDELEELELGHARARDEGRPRLVTVVGDAGVGKTRLVREFWDRLGSEDPPPLRRTGRCPAYGRGVTYEPLADVLREQLSLRETDDAEEILGRLGDREVLGATLGLDVASDLHPLAARERLHEGWIELLSELTAERPVVVLIEDLHWAQEPLLDLLERLLDEVEGPLHLIATARPEFVEARPAWGRRREAVTIWLEPLSAADADTLLSDLHTAGMPAELRQSVLARAEGNPFFLEELLANLVDQGVLSGGGQGSPAAEVPDSVQAVLAARIDNLPATEKEALQAASVIGRVFWRGAVIDLIEGDAPELSLLESRDFIRRRSPSALAGEREFTFKHSLTREVAYSTLPKARRAALHADFARWLERLTGDRDERAAMLARHFAEAVRPEDADLAWGDRPGELEHLRGEALKWLGRAAELAVSRYEIDDGIAMLERALDLPTPDEARVELWRAIGRASALKYDGERFWTAMQQAIALCSDRTTLAELYSELAMETSYRAGMWLHRPDRALVDGWIETALELTAPGTAARAKALIAWCNWNPEGAGDAPRQAHEIAERLPDPMLRSHALDVMGIAAFVAGDYERGWECEERRFELLDQITDPEHVADVYYAPITGYALRGEIDGARRLARKHEEISLGLTDHHRIHGIAVLLEVEELAGGWESIRELQGIAEERVAANAETPCVRNARSLLVCAVARYLAGEAEEASRLEHTAEEMGMQGFGHVLDTPRIRLALLREDLDRVDELLAEPLPDRGWHRGWLLISTHATRLDALAALDRRDSVEAWGEMALNPYLAPFRIRALALVRDDERLLDQAGEEFERLGLHWHAARTRSLLGTG